MSKFLSLQTYDYVKGVALTAIQTALVKASLLLDGGTLPSHVQLKVLAYGALATFVGYLVKNYLTNSQGKLFVAEPKPVDEVKV